MIRLETRLKAWGNSIGIIIPKEDFEEENLEVNDEVEVLIKKKTNVLKEAFGKLKKVKAKKSNIELLKEVDRELESKYIK